MREIGTITHKLEERKEEEKEEPLPMSMSMDVDEDGDEDDDEDDDEKRYKLVSQKKNSLGSRKFMKNFRNLHLCLVAAEMFGVPKEISDLLDATCRFVGLTFSEVWEARHPAIYREYGLDILSRMDKLRAHSVFTKKRVFVNGFKQNVNIHAIPALIDIHGYIKTPQSNWWPGFETQNNV